MRASEQYSEVREIADAICEQQVSTEQLQRLEVLLTGDPAAKRFYLNYLSMHMQLSSAAQPNLEFIYRRMQMAEEFIVRPLDNNLSGEQDLQAGDVNQQAFVGQAKVGQVKKDKTPLKWFAYSVLLLAVVISLWLLNQGSPNDYNAEIIRGHFSIVNLGHIDGNYLAVGEYANQQDAKLKLITGEIIQLKANSRIKLVNQNEIALKQGALKVLPLPSHNLVVHGPSFSLYSKGSLLSVDLTRTSPVVKTGENTLLLPKRWRPAHYWSFDGASDRAIDSAGSAHGLLSANVSRSKGLLGQGAFFFDNNYFARIDVGSGGGVAPATGSFAVTDGVTIEALIRPQYSGVVNDMDEIFRKDQSDKELRMLLSFQHDPIVKPFLKPEGIYQESLSFGLYLVGQGYHELKLPLDGLDGRPTLAELKRGGAHHVVATYDVRTGGKAIYIDGKRHAFYQYPPGSKMLSGGRGSANIGNSPNHNTKPGPTDGPGRANNEAFAGVLDEVAFYDFALPAFMVESHLVKINNGQNYFGLLPSARTLPQQIELVLPANSTLELDPLTGLPNKVVSQ